MTTWGAIWRELCHFNPHLPYGRWRSICPMRRRNGDFNPHLPRGRWRYHTGQNPDAGAISIHTFLAEGDRRLYIWLHTLMNFNPHLPRGRWQSIFQRLQWQMWFQSTPSSRKVTRDRILDRPHLSAFQSTPSSRKVTEEHSRDTVRNNNFNPHLPRGRWL